MFGATDPETDELGLWRLGSLHLLEDPGDGARNREATSGGMIGPMANVQPPSGRFGCLTAIMGAVVLAAIVVLVVFVGVFVLAIAAALVVVGLIAIGVDRLMLAVSPKRRARRESQARAFLWRYGPANAGEVIETTAVDATEESRDPAHKDRKPDQMGPQ